MASLESPSSWQHGLGKDTVSYLHIGKVDPIEITEHLVYLGSVLQHRTSSLSQVVQGCVSP